MRRRHIVLNTMRGAIAATLLLVVATLALAVDTEDPAPGAGSTAKSLAEERELIRLFADTLEQVKTNYAGTNISERELIEAAIEGMISKLDPYSNYIPPAELEEFRKGVENEYVGIGIQVEERDGHLQITSPLFGTPAWRAGLRAGDRILKIDETSARGLSVRNAVKLTTGEPGTDVTISVLHPDESEAETVVLQREVIQQPTVLGYRRNAEGVWDYYQDAEAKIGYIRLIAFSSHTSEDLQKALTQLLAEGLRGLVLDLRGNPGGMLSEAIKVSDLFVRQGKIVSIEGRSTASRSWDVRQEGTLIPEDFPVAVIVNRFSASAAEIVSACLQDNHIAVIVGERTWGKGSVQNIIELERGRSALKLTTAGYQRPSGQNIHREPGASEEAVWGVTPDEGYAVPFTQIDMINLGIRFAHLDALTEQMHTPAEDQQEAEFVDQQLEKSLEYLRDRLGISPVPVTVGPAGDEPAKGEAEEKADG